MARHQLSFKLSNLVRFILVIVFLVTLRLLSMSSYLSPTFTNSTKSEPQMSQNLSEKQFLEMTFDPTQNFDIDEDAEVDSEITEEMRGVIDELRQQIRRETEGYKPPLLGEVDDLIPEKGGTPMRSVVITTWRSGSTFIGGVLNSHPATFHFSEPLTDYRTVQVRGEPLGSPAIRALHALLTCNYDVLGRYLERSKEYTWLFTHNTRLWQHCSQHNGICWQPQFLKPVCSLFPFQSMKVVHIRLRLVEQLLADPKLNVRVLYLVRDPRGVMGSRSSLSWCLDHEDCSSAVRVCADLVDDYSAAMRFSAMFPTKFKAVRYEDMSLRPDVVIPDIFKFFHLQYHSDVQEFVNKHTTQARNNRYSTYRNSSATALSWRLKSTYTKVRDLQSVCRVAMSAWGYLAAKSQSHLRKFNPIVEPFKFP